MPDGPPARIEGLLALATARRRRLASYYLAGRSGPVPVEELAEAVAAAERRFPRDRVDPAAVQTVQRSLVAEELPRLAAADLVSYDSLAGLVAFRDDATLARRLLVTVGRLELRDGSRGVDWGAG